MYIWAGENRPGSQDFYFSQVHPVLKYMIIIGFSRPVLTTRFSFWKLIFNLIIIYLLKKIKKFKTTLKYMEI